LQGCENAVVGFGLVALDRRRKMVAVVEVVVVVMARVRVDEGVRRKVVG